MGKLSQLAWTVDREADRLVHLSKVSVRQSGYSVYSLLSLALFFTVRQPPIQYRLQSFNKNVLAFCKSSRLIKSYCSRRLRLGIKGDICML